MNVRCLAQSPVDLGVVSAPQSLATIPVFDSFPVPIAGQTSLPLLFVGREELIISILQSMKTKAQREEVTGRWSESRCLKTSPGALAAEPMSVPFICPPLLAQPWAL